MSKPDYITLPLRLKTSDTIFGRLHNILFITTSVLTTLYRYYVHGPESPKWTLRFHVIKNILHNYLSESLPHTTPNDLTEQIDFSFIARYIEMNNLPSRALTPDAGCNREFLIDAAALCMPYRLERYGESGNKLNVLAEADREAGRKISCQVVVGASLCGCTCSSERLLDAQPLCADERAILHFHGGAYCVGERSLTHLYVYASMSQATGLRVFSPNYRLAPAHCFPRQLHDCFLAYRHMLLVGFQPHNITLAGDSAGGALVLALLLVLREMQMPLPRNLLLVSPWVDATCSGRSWVTNQGKDYLPGLTLEDPFHPTRMFYEAGRRLDQHMLEELRCPLVSPVFGSFEGMPPMLVQMGRDELLRDDIAEFVHKVQKQSKEPAVLQSYKDMPHAFILLHFAESAKRAFECMREFLEQH
ncbi:hypothetical protein GGI15_003568 [Coemansia interrupta]|uniref:Alpha/beta hydrolase fold-3 domain-containing protein n=1 Tax=Coemansia interrupta TaxID=1126814 RepID=A0A9W8HA89_9FUNG|nr:hypothetical protein GGI15_003568 [Coemansia interrupta]